MPTDDMAKRVNALVRGLASWRRAKREQAERDLRALGPEAVEPLACLYADEARIHRIRVKLGVILWKSLFISTVISTLRDFPLASRFMGHGGMSNIPIVVVSWVAMVGAVMSFVVLLPMIVLIPVSSRRLRSIRYALSRFNHGQTVRTLIRLTPKRLLSVLLASTCQSRYAFDADLAICAIRAVKRVGDDSFIPALDTLLTAPSPKRDKRIRYEARYARDVIIDRRDDRSPARTLMRPADAPNDTLLRPAANAPGDERVLLRPAEGLLSHDSGLTSLDSDLLRPAVAEGEDDANPLTH